MNTRVPMRDQELDALISLGAPDCVDPSAIDHADLIAFAKGRTAPDISARVTEHLSACSHCTATSREYLRIEEEAAARRRRIWVAGVGITALAASIAGLVFVRAPSPVPAYRFVEVGGRIAQTMSGERPGELDNKEWVFAPAAEPDIVLAPVGRGAHSEFLDAAAYTLRDGKLERVPAELMHREGREDFATFRLRAPRDALISVCPGSAKLFVVVSGRKSQFDDLDGLTREAANRELRDAQLLEATLRCDDAAN